MALSISMEVQAAVDIITTTIENIVMDDTMRGNKE